MTTKYGALVRMWLFLLAFLAAAGGAIFVVGGANAQAPVDEPVAPAQANEPDIIGGREATPGAWPWQVALIDGLSQNPYLGQICGGTLIAEDWILTAAHCVEGRPVSLTDVLVGAHKLSDSGTRIRAAQIIPHPDYDPFMLQNDLALIRLSTPVTYTPIALFEVISGTTELDYMRATVTGWGMSDLSAQYGYPDALREVSLPLVSREQCARNLWYETITDKMICAGYETLTMGSCYGDSGGPLMVQEADASWSQIGIVSWGPYGCIDVGRYDVFTRVSQYTDWIAGCTADPDGLHCRGGDAYEPDNDAATAQQLGGPIANQMHTFHEMGDQDWIRMDVESGKEYMFVTGRVTETVPFLKTVLWLFDGDGRTPITYTETLSTPEWAPWTPDSFDQSARLVWMADRTGPIYMSVELLPSYYGQIYGPSTRYWLTVGENIRSFLPLVAVPIPEPPSNDDFAQPVDVAPFPFNHVINTTNATVAVDDPQLFCTGTQGSATVWYQFVAPAAGLLTVDTFNSGYDTVLAVFSGERGALNVLACSDDYLGRQSRVDLAVAEGETYFIEVAGYAPVSAAGVKALASTSGETPVQPSSAQGGGWLNLSASFIEFVEGIPAP